MRAFEHAAACCCCLMLHGVMPCPSRRQSSAGVLDGARAAPRFRFDSRCPRPPCTPSHTPLLTTLHHLPQLPVIRPIIDPEEGGRDYEFLAAPDDPAGPRTCLNFARYAGLGFDPALHMWFRQPPRVKPVKVRSEGGAARPASARAAASVCCLHPRPPTSLPSMHAVLHSMLLLLQPQTHAHPSISPPLTTGWRPLPEAVGPQRQPAARHSQLAAGRGQGAAHRPLDGAPRQRAQRPAVSPQPFSLLFYTAECLAGCLAVRV